MQQYADALVDVCALGERCVKSIQIMSNLVAGGGIQKWSEMVTNGNYNLWFGNPCPTLSADGLT
jgi:hypothetical protein